MREDQACFSPVVRQAVSLLLNFSLDSQIDQNTVTTLRSSPQEDRGFS